MVQTRRQFCQTIGITSAVVLAGNTGYSYCRQIPKVPFGKTGLNVSRIGFSTSQLHTASSDQEADHLIRYMLDSGVNYIDSSPFYGMGYADELLGTIIPNQREQVVIATKTRSLDYQSTMKEIDESLKRLQTDYVDVVMLDNPNIKHKEQVVSGDGALAAVLKAKEQGKCRFVGLTGLSHPQWTLSYINQYPFDVVQIPLNAVDSHYLSFENEVLSTLNQTKTAIVGSKTHAVGKLRDSEFISKQDALDYALSLPVSVTLVSSSSKSQARVDISAFYKMGRISVEEKERILTQTKPLSTRDVEWYKAIA